ncbi:DUF5685 family protein [Nocardia australiensis]|uniref:DUF5685 family protein n=1 Tax=Nocardia australiensis TaxID=2887191 RepID=UPI001D136FA4|nr:DUF5685 family protein [Nocardia australiensis]
MRGAKLFGMLRPCSHSAEKHGIDPAEWQAHMCGLCVGLRDGHGQLARAATNTDAIVLSMLTEAQLGGSKQRSTAGPCALRGMRRASVVGADSPGVQLASTASLLLGSAKIRDHIDDGDGSVLTRAPMAKVSSRWADRARAQAELIGFDVEPLVAAIDSQATVEARAGQPERAAESVTGAVSLDDLTEPAQLCAAEFFAHTAVLAQRPENAEPLRVAGRNFGRIAHLFDAVEDLDDDLAHDRFNPLAATETSIADSYDLLRQYNSELNEAIADIRLDQVPTVRWMLLDPLAGLVRRVGHAGGAIRCGSSSHYPQYPGQNPYPPYGRPPERKPSLLEGIGLLLGQYPTGYACCADHRRPCSGKRKEAWRKRVDFCNCCDCCDCGGDLCCD